ncbi:hypothetical protein LJC12_03170 [Odoribacter sp. OttesenSCG-928-J03]|nr:hypothetical protein [Odoribacter sp. OttesenSCG-928-J03]
MTNMITLLADRALETGGYMISIVSILVVFASLAVLICIFTTIPKVLELKARRNMKKEGEAPVSEVNVEANINVAIAMGLHMYFNELHDEESNIITIKSAPKQYSPWNSKIYGVQNQPVRKR